MKQVTLLFSVVIVLIANLFAQGPSETSAVIKTKRPRVGLALDSGGALGLAHVGVILWMDEHHVPVDYIAGTSMGGLVGGAYATGMNGNELKTFVSKIDWDTTVFNSRSQYKDLPFRLKADEREYPGSVEFGLNHGLKMPNGLNSGANVDRVISGFALPYSNVENFDDLPVPFRCIATDLNSGTMHVFRTGVLGNALRATMSIPAIFEPVRIGDKLFVDGTLVDPLPTDVVREMGADVVVAVYLESYVPNKTPESPFGALFRSLEAVTLNAERRNMKSADLLITVPLLDRNNLEYDRWEEIVSRGYSEAEKNSAALSKYALSDEQWKQYLAEKESRKKPSPVVQKVKVNGDSATTAGLHAMCGKSLDPAAVDGKVVEMEAEGRYSRIHPRLTTNGDNSLTLDFEAVTKEYGPVLMEPLLLLDGSDYNNVRFSAGGRFVMPNVGLYRSEMRTDVLIGSSYRLATEYYWPIAGSKHWFTSTHAGVANSPMDFYTRDGKAAEYRRIETSGGFDLGYAFNRFSELRVGYEVGWTKYSNELGPQFLSADFNGTQTIANVRFTLDRTDDPVIPRSGYGLESLFAYYDRRPGAAESFPSLQLKVQGYRPTGEKGSIYVIGSAGSTFGFTDAGFPLYSLGSSTRLAAYGSNEVLTNQYWLVQAGYIHKIMSMPPMTGKNVYLTSGFELAKPFYTTDVSRLPVDVRLGVIAQTLLGPVQLGGSFGDTGHKKIYFQVGRVF
ncbi:MAG TPA: patatin-like phospholipase family protein [Terriglobales bacterium]